MIQRELEGDVEEPYNETSTTDRVFTGQTQSTTSGDTITCSASFGRG